MASTDNIYDSTLALSNKLTLIERQSMKRSGCCDKVTSVAESFSIGTMLNDVFSTKSKPWEDRELDLFSGLHMMSFMFTTICLTSMAFSIGWFMDLL